MLSWRYPNVVAAGVTAAAVLALAGCANPSRPASAAGPLSDTVSVAAGIGHLAPAHQFPRPGKGRPSPAPGPVEAASRAAENAAELAADAVDSYGGAQFVDTYGGVMITRPGIGVQIYLTRYDPIEQAELRAVAARADLSGKVPTAVVSFAITPTTRSQRLALVNELSTAWGQLRGQGYALVKAVEDIPAGTETLQLLHPTPVQVTALTDRFGPHLKVQAVTPDQQVFAS